MIIASRDIMIADKHFRFHYGYPRDNVEVNFHPLLKEKFTEFVELLRRNDDLVFIVIDTDLTESEIEELFGEEYRYNSDIIFTYL